MSPFLPMALAGSYLVLAAATDKVPKLNYQPSCKAATTSGLINRNEDACKQDEEAARNQLEKEWTSFSANQRGHCLRLTTLGGPPSYVELLTCLEMAKEAEGLKDGLKIDEQIER